MPFEGRDWLRTLVLKTNRIWPLGQCNRIPYAAAVRLLVGAFKRCPEIASIYLRHGLAGNEWIPGLSDIDLTVILENGLSVEEEYAFLERFWSTYDRLKRYFPMLGEVIILVDGEFGLWQTYSSTTPHGQRGVLLHGRETAENVSVDAAVWRRRALNLALWLYLESLPPCLSRPDSYLRRQDVARRERKILRCLEPIVTGALPRPGPIERVRDSTEAVACILKALEAAAMAVSGVTSPVPTGNGNGIRGVISTDAGRVLVVLEDGLDPGVLSRLIRAHLPPDPGRGAPVLLPHALFEYVISHYKPYSHSKLQSGRTLVSGEDPLPGIRPPGKLAFEAFTLDRIAYLLTMTRGEELLSTREPFSPPVLESAVTDGLAVHLLLRDDWVGSNWRAVDAACRSKFSEYYRELEAVRGYLAAGNGREARRASFRLFRPIATGILDLAGGRSARLMQH
jgi:hypothetical protein